MVFNRLTLGWLFYKLRILQKDDRRSYPFVIVEQKSLCTAEIPIAISALPGSSNQLRDKVFNNGREIHYVHLCDRCYLFL